MHVQKSKPLKRSAVAATKVFSGPWEVAITLEIELTGTLANIQHSKAKDMSLFEMLLQLRHDGWTLAPLTRRRGRARVLPPPFNCEHNSPKIVHLSEGKLPHRSYLLCLLSPKELLDTGVSEVQHGQPITYYIKMLQGASVLEKRQAKRKRGQDALEIDDGGLDVGAIGESRQRRQMQEEVGSEDLEPLHAEDAAELMLGLVPLPLFA